MDPILNFNFKYKYFHGSLYKILFLNQERLVFFPIEQRLSLSCTKIMMKEIYFEIPILKKKYFRIWFKSGINCRFLFQSNLINTSASVGVVSSI